MVLFKDAHVPKKLNLTTEKTFLPNERAEAKNEAARLLREKGVTRKFEIGEMR